MSSGDVFEQVLKGVISPKQGAAMLEEERELTRRPSKPAWLPRPLYLVGILLLTLLLPKLVGRSS